MTARVVLLCILSLTTVGCPKPVDPPKRVEIFQTTAAPPSRSAMVTNSDTTHRITLARGVAIAVQSWTNCPDSPLSLVTSADPAVLGARRVYRNGQANQFVVWGQQPGVTSLVVANGCADQRYDVTVTGE